jgi:hypothetical protein
MKQEELFVDAVLHELEKRAEPSWGQLAGSRGKSTGRLALGLGKGLGGHVAAMAAIGGGTILGAKAVQKLRGGIKPASPDMFEKQAFARVIKGLMVGGKRAYRKRWGPRAIVPKGGPKKSGAGRVAKNIAIAGGLNIGSGAALGALDEAVFPTKSAPQQKQPLQNTTNSAR